MKCAICSAEFEASSPRQVYCSLLCRSRSQTRRKSAERAAKRAATITCFTCGEPFVPKQSRSRFCKDACRTAPKIAQLRTYPKVASIGVEFMKQSGTAVIQAVRGDKCRGCNQPILIPCQPPYERLCTWCMADARMPADKRRELQEQNRWHR